MSTPQLMSEYLALHAKNGTIDRLPEGSIAGVLNLASPEERQAMKASQQVVENFRESGGRSMPFQEKKSLDDLGIDANIRKVMDQHDTEDMTVRLNQRMGTPTQDTSPPSMRDAIDLAFTEHEGAEHD